MGILLYAGDSIDRTSREELDIAYELSRGEVMEKAEMQQVIKTRYGTFASRAGKKESC
jgi:hypothetical protein